MGPIHPVWGHVLVSFPGCETLRTSFTYFPKQACIVALMGFSRYSPSSSDLTNFVVRSHRGECSGYLWLTAWKSGTWTSGNLGSNKIQNIKILKIKIRVAQNVGKVWISRKKILLAPFHAISGIFLRGPEKCKKCQICAYVPWWANGPYSPGYIWQGW